MKHENGYYGWNYKVVPTSWGRDKIIGLDYRSVIDLEEMANAGFSAKEIIQLIKESLDKINK